MYRMKAIMHLKVLFVLRLPVIITSQFPANSTLVTDYEPGLLARFAGAIPTGNMTSAAATVKFSWVLARVNSELKNRKLDKKNKLNRIKELMKEIYILEMDDSND